VGMSFSSGNYVMLRNVVAFLKCDFVHHERHCNKTELERLLGCEL